jgi:hypothetical protein
MLCEEQDEALRWFQRWVARTSGQIGCSIVPSKTCVAAVGVRRNNSLLCEREARKHMHGWFCRESLNGRNVTK